VEAFLTSMALVAVAEIGDKTQLLSFALAARLRKPGPIIAGILFATLANHALAGWLGVLIAAHLDARTERWATAIAFFAFALWALKPDELDGAPERARGGAFLTTLAAFFIVEMGDKTQLATIALAARFESLAAVVLGTTIGMMIANVPAVLIGERLAARLDLRLMRLMAAGLFAVTGVLALLA
jgi:putative Ca2+/H+ antiporter (TMEM165/GDT1 family)